MSWIHATETAPQIGADRRAASLECGSLKVSVPQLFTTAVTFQDAWASLGGVCGSRAWRVSLIPLEKNWRKVSCRAPSGPVRLCCLLFPALLSCCSLCCTDSQTTHYGEEWTHMHFFPICVCSCTLNDWHSQSCNSSPFHLQDFYWLTPRHAGKG